MLASHNLAKVREIRQVLAPLRVPVLSLDDIGFGGEIEEIGDTFAENAAAKALAVGRMTGGLALADDSGLVVDALDGRPGVQSARYGGEGLTDPERVELLLRELADVPHGRRLARFVCVLALAEGDRLLATWAGRVAGLIAEEARGTGGFGYDPVFVYVPLDKTFAELTPAEKNALSHRGRAVRQLPRHLAAVRDRR